MASRSSSPVRASRAAGDDGAHQRVRGREARGAPKSGSDGPLGHFVARPRPGASGALELWRPGLPDHCSLAAQAACLGQHHLAGFIVEREDDLGVGEAVEECHGPSQ